MNYNKYNPRCNSGTKWSCGDDGAVGEDDVDNDPDEARGDDYDDGDDFPLREGISPADFSLPELFFSPSGFHLVEAVEKLLLAAPRHF